MEERKVTDEEIVAVVRHLESVEVGKIFKDPDLKQWMIVGLGRIEEAPGSVFCVGSFDHAFTAAADLIKSYQEESR